MPAFCPVQPSIGTVSIRRDKSRIAVRGPPFLIIGCLMSAENQRVIRILIHAVIVPRRENNPAAVAHSENSDMNHYPAARKVSQRVSVETAREAPEFRPSRVAKVYLKTVDEIWFCRNCAREYAGRIVRDIDAPDVARVGPETGRESSTPHDGLCFCQTVSVFRRGPQTSSESPFIGSPEAGRNGLPGRSLP